MGRGNSLQREGWGCPGVSYKSREGGVVGVCGGECVWGGWVCVWVSVGSGCVGVYVGGVCVCGYVCREWVCGCRGMCGGGECVYRGVCGYVCV